MLYQIIDAKIQKSHTKTINLKYHLSRGVENLDCITDRILYQILKIIFKKQGEEADIFNRNIRK